jgi:sn-glycerol 3-phosphate transport system permease protein
MINRNLTLLLRPFEKTVFLKTIFSVFLLLLGLIMIAPFLWMIITSLQPDVRAVMRRPTSLPLPPAFSNYLSAWRSAPFLIYTFNSVFIALSVTVLQLINASLAAYAFSKLQFPGRNLLFMLILTVMMIPAQVAIVPLYSLLAKFHWLDTYQGLILPFAADAFGIFLVRQYFMSIPDDYIDAGKMEGAGHLRILFRIMMPLARPSLIAFAIMAFKWRWNDYFWVLIMTSRDVMRTLPVGLVMMKEGSDGGTKWHIVMAATLLVMVPVILLYAAMQKYFTNDFNRGGLKG